MLQCDGISNEEEKAFSTITIKTHLLSVFVTSTINTVLKCNMIIWESLLGKKKEVNLVADDAEVSLLSRSRKVYQSVQEELSNKESPRPQVVSEENVPEDPVLTQMKKTNANLSIWGLLCVSKKYMDALSKSLAQAVIAIDTSLSSLTQIIGNIYFGNVIMFFELDIPKAGPIIWMPLTLLWTIETLESLKCL